MQIPTEVKMTSVITKTTLESNAYDNVISFLDDRSIVTDPRDPAGYQKRTFIYDTDPLAKGVNFGEFPYIIAEFPMLEYSNTSTDGKTKEIAWKMNITVRTSRNGSSQGTTGVGKKDMFTICDSLQVLFNTLTYRQQFADLRMFFMKLTKLGVDSITSNQEYIYESSYELTFLERIQVSD